MKLTAQDLALLTTATDRAWRACKQPAWSSSESQALLTLSMKLEGYLKSIQAELTVR